MQRVVDVRLLRGLVFDMQFSLPVKLGLIVMLGVIAFYVVGISQVPAVHEAFHDVRHASGFPCH